MITSYIHAQQFKHNEEYIINRKHDTFFEDLENTISLYDYFEYKVCTLLTDSEFVRLKNRLLRLGVLLNPAAAHEHVGGYRMLYMHHQRKSTRDHYNSNLQQHS